MRRQAELVLGLVFGVLATIGGWWFLLSMFDLTPVFLNEYTILNFILGLVTIAALLCSLALAGLTFSGMLSRATRRIRKIDHRYSS